MIDIRDAETLVLAFAVETLSIHNAGDALERLKSAASASDKNVELDFGTVINIDSSAVAMLVKFVQHLSGAKRNITMTRVRPEIMQTFKVLRLTSFFKFK